jgi:hypothetical protein
MIFSTCCGSTGSCDPRSSFSLRLISLIVLARFDAAAASEAAQLPGLSAVFATPTCGPIDRCGLHSTGCSTVTNTSRHWQKQLIPTHQRKQGFYVSGGFGEFP